MNAPGSGGRSRQGLLASFVRSRLVQSGALRRLVPAPLRALVRRRVPVAVYLGEQHRRDAEALLGGPVPSRGQGDGRSALRVGILADEDWSFASVVAACRDLGLGYDVVRLGRSGWLDEVRKARCDVWTATPASQLEAWRASYEERVRIAERELGLCVIPSADALWLWEKKHRLRDFLAARGIPHPKTEVFTDLDEALAFVERSPLPLVLKTERGAAATGVFVLRRRGEALRLVRRAFAAGLVARGADPRDPQRHALLVQEYVAHDCEWRVVRVGPWYFCRKKSRLGDFASGSGAIGCALPPSGMLDFVERLTDAAGFCHMAVDMFVAPDGGFLVNELQCQFGMRVTPQNAATGRFRREAGSGAWRHQPGFFYQNLCWNLRLAVTLEERGLEAPAPWATSAPWLPTAS